MSVSKGDKHYVEPYASEKRLTIIRDTLIGFDASQSLLLADDSNLPKDSENVSNSPYKIFNNRLYTAFSPGYELPADTPEHLRLDLQHFSLCLQMNSLYPLGSVVSEVLTDSRSSLPPLRVLDAGTGSGGWAIEMAEAYPAIQFLATDLVYPNTPSKETIPPNLTFKIHDANLPMDEDLGGSFSLVHALAIGAGLNDPRHFFYDAARLLRPGGILIFGIGDLQLFDERERPLPCRRPEQAG